MSDSIDLLDTIGKDASLRYASHDELAEALQSAGASDALKKAASGDRSALSAELGSKPAQVPQTQIPGHEEQQPDHDEEARPGMPPERSARQPSENKHHETID